MAKSKRPHSFWYRNGLSLVFIALFLATLVAQAFTGWREYCNELQDHNRAAIGFRAYLHTGHFISATFENFQSEFLQMALYVILTISLRQWGSAESKKLDEKEEVDREPQSSARAPWAVRRGGFWLKLYSHSLSVAFIVLFLLSWGMHLYGSFEDYNAEQMMVGKPPVSLVSYFGEPLFWFETFQNWQSEFLSVASIVILSIFLRQKGSPESKPVDAPHTETGK